MRTYEHWVESLEAIAVDERADLLDQYGEQGWRLVSVDHDIAYFRRPVVEGRT